MWLNICRVLWGNKSKAHKTLLLLLQSQKDQSVKVSLLLLRMVHTEARHRVDITEASLSCLYSYTQIGGFHLHLLVFPFVYQFNSRGSSPFIICKCKRISTTFQHHFKICFLWFLHEKECSFYTYFFFCCSEMRWMFIISTAIWFTGWDTSSVASRARCD